MFINEFLVERYNIEFMIVINYGIGLWLSGTSGSADNALDVEVTDTVLESQCQHQN